MLSIESFIRDIPDFPKPGIVFKDITPLLASPEAMNDCLGLLVNAIKGKHIDKVIGIESRGFFFATLLAKELNAGFVPARKKGKLPYSTYQASYELEYGTDIIEIHTDGIMPGDKVLIHDDVLATGGTAQAACKLVEEAGGEIVLVSFLMELGFLNGKEKIKKYDVYSVLKY